MGECRFCFVPKGVGFTNGRLMETFFTGCIPVILSDAMVVPFAEFLDWSRCVRNAGPGREYPGQPKVSESSHI